MTRKSYEVGELLALRGRSHFSHERRFIDAMGRRGDCAEILCVRHLVSLNNPAEQFSLSVKDAAPVGEPIRQQLDGQELDVKVHEDHGEAHLALPQSAPADLGAQFAAGFGQFIKAVTSPTNVRVTAGGRIVANTRGTSPTGKGNRDKGNGEDFNLSRPGSQTGAVGLVGPVPNHFMQPHTVFPAFNPVQFPGHVAFFPQMPYPMGPMSVGPGMLPTPPSYQPAQYANKTANDEEDKTASAAQQKTSSGGQGEVNPPYAFPPSVHGPFFPQGSLIPMPMQMPMHMMHPHMTMQAHAGSVPGFAPNPGFPPGPVFSAPMMPQPSQQPLSMAPSASSQAQGQQYPATTGHAHSIHAPASSIKLSDVIKKHLDGFREHLKWCQSQIDYNKHQIDEKDMLDRTKDLRNQIKHNEAKLEQQLAIEQEMADLDRSSKNTVKPVAANNQQPRQVFDTSSAVSGAAEQLSNSQAPNSQLKDDDHKDGKALRVEARSSQDVTDESEAGKKLAYKKDRTRSKTWNSKQKSRIFKASTDNEDKSDSSSAFMPLGAQSHNIASEPIKKSSRLPMNAALAPPFHPRGYHQLGSQDVSSDSATKFQDENAAVSIAPKYSTSSDVSQGFTRGFSHTVSPIAHAGAPSSVIGGGFGIPYLEGRLRPGVDPRKATDEDYHYPRKLTKEELQSRRLYWGKAPESVTRGLPKYDGKNFYPSSSVKVNTYSYIEPVKPTLPVGGLAGYGPNHAATLGPSLVVAMDGKQTDYKALLMEQYAKGEKADKQEREKRFTKSDDINGGLAMGKRVHKERPTASLMSQGMSYSDQISETRGGAASMQPQTLSSESDSSHEILFQGRRSVQRSSTRSGLWQNLGKKSSAGSANALPGAMSSTTAHGVLPQYAGTAAASLNPGKTPVPVLTGSPCKVPKFEDHGVNGRRGENKPPFDTKATDLRF